MGNFTMKSVIAFCLLIVMTTAAIGQSLTHPHIWIKDSEKSAILSKIDNTQWAASLLEKYKTRVDPSKDSHKLDPSTIINSIPGFPGNRTTHNNILTLGYEASLLYWLTGDEDYGQLAADILYYYTKKIAAISGNLNFHTGGEFLIESRESYTKPPMIYDFVYQFIKKSTTKVYNRDSNNRVSFSFTYAENAFKKMADQVFTRGGINSNHPVLEAPGALFNVLAIENDATRNTYFNKFMNGTSNQNGLTWMMNECKESGVWPESTGYSIGPHRIILHLMEVVDKYDPSRNIINQNKDLIKNAFFFENYRFPNNVDVMRFGDAHRERLNTQAIMERVLTISSRKGYGTLKNQASEILKSQYAAKGGYNPSVITQSLEWNNPLALLWGVDVAITNVTPITYDRSIAIEYAGIAMQRNINTSDRVESGLMAYTGGAHYVHSHLSGLDMELYGLGAVLGTGGGDVGASNRDDDVFRNYHRIYAGHNTVIVNGTSKGRIAGSWKSDGQLYMNTTKTLAAEPASLTDAVSDNFSFSTQQLDDAVNNAKQQRVLSIVRTSENTGYYLDLFRSKSNGTNNYHDYVYHNVGDGVTMVDGNNANVPLTTKADRYESIKSINGSSFVMFPGWHYFEEVKTSNKTTAAIKATIPMTKEGNRYMHMLMPGGEDREYTACKGPATIEATVGYENEKTPIVTVRHTGEAWTKPFISVFEPSRNANGTVQSIENLYTGSKIVGAKVTSLVAGKTITDYIISNENATDTYTSADGKITFKGRFGVVRTEPVSGATQVTLYIGEGETLSFDELSLDAGTDKKGQLVSQIADEVTKVVAASVTAPANNSTYILGETITLSADASTNVGSIAKVNFRIDGGYYKQVTSAPYGTTWTPTAAGTYAIDLAVYDSENDRFISESITVNIIEPQVTTVTITAPANNSTITVDETVNITADASTTIGSISKVNFRVNGAYFKQDTEAPYDVTWTPTVAGTYTIDAVAYDNNNVSTVSSSVTVVVEVADISGIYRLKNVATGLFMDSNGTSVKTGTDNYNLDRQWSVVKVGDELYNIDSEFAGRGCLEVGASGLVANSTVENISLVNDKVWKAINLGNNVFRFESQDVAGNLSADVSTLVVGWSNSTGDDTKWELEYVSQLKSGTIDFSVAEDKIVDVSVYPNPANSEFTITVKGSKETAISIYNLNGALMYNTVTTKQSVNLTTSGWLKTGMYIIKVVGDNQKVYHQKLIVE